MSSGAWAKRISQFHGGLQAAFSKALAATPFIAAIITVVTIAGPPNSGRDQVSIAPALPPVVAAIVYLCVTWVIVALLLHFSGRMTPKLVNPASYYSLHTRLIELEASHLHVCHKSVAAALPEAPCTSEDTKCAVGRYLTSARDELAQEGSRWMLGNGYSSTWEKLHRAEEALITFSSDETVSTGAKMDKLRTNGSQMKNARELCSELDRVIFTLTRRTRRRGPFIGRLRSERNKVIRPLTAGKKTSSQTRNAQLDEGNAKESLNGTDATATVHEAKLMASHIRQAINEYRDRQWAQLIRRRGELTAATTFTAFTVYVLLWTAILWDADRDSILAGVTYFLIGAIVGLFNHIQIESDGSAGDSIDDYGASHARLFVTVLLSGLAALGGVVVVAILTLTQTVNLAQAGKVGPLNQDTSLLVNLLSIRIYPLNLIVALTFGLTPRLLIARLKAQADEAKGAIKTSKAVDGDLIVASTPL